MPIAAERPASRRCDRAMDGAAPPEEDFSRLTVAERLGHKVWKARVSAYEELAKVRHRAPALVLTSQTFAATADEADAAFRPYLSDPDALRRAVLDANAVAQEKALDCVLAFVEFAGPAGATKTAEAVVPALVDKCLGSARAGTRTKAIELCVLYVECAGTSEPVVGCLVDGLKAKQPKTVAGCVSALRDLVRSVSAISMQLTRQGVRRARDRRQAHPQSLADHLRAHGQDGPRRGPSTHARAR